MSTQDQARLQRKLRELIGDDRITITGGSGASFTDDSGQEVRAENLDGSNRHFNQVRDRVFKPPIEDDVFETPDVAVVLGCEKDDRYDLWLTYLGDDRRNQFAFLGSFPRKLQTDQYWAWESNQVGRFEFNPYTGATGGFGGGVQSLTNYDGAIVDAGPQGAFYQSEGWHGGGDKGGVVTPIWSRVLTDYEVHASAYLQTLCHPLGTYTDVSWEWSDGATGLYKVDGGGATGSSSEKQTGKTWTVNWSYEGGGGGVSLNQEESPRVNKKMKKGDQEEEIPPEVTKVWIVTWLDEEKLFFTGKDDVLTTVVEVLEDQGGLTLLETTLPTGTIDRGTVIPGYSGTVPEGEVWSITRADSIWGSPGEFFYPAGSVFSVVRDHVAYVYIGVSTINGGSQNWHLNSKYEISDLFKVNVLVNGQSVFSSEGYTEEPDPSAVGYVIDPDDPELSPPPGYTYTIQVFDKDGIEVASDSAGTPISSSIDETIHYVLGIYIQKKDGQNLGGQFQSGDPFIPAGFSAGDDVPHKFRRYTSKDKISAEIEDIDIYAQISAWVEVVEEQLARVNIEGREGQEIREGSVYEEATRPYVGPDGKLVFPCYPQKSGADPKEESRKFQASSGFNAYHITWYNARDENGSIVETVYFDFNQPGLSGQLPSPSINYDYSLVSTDLNLSFDLKAWASYGKDVPEEDPETGATTNLEEEKIDKVDPVGVVTVAAMGFVYGLYGPTKVSQIVNQTIDAERKNEDGSITRQTLSRDYDTMVWNVRNRARKPRSYLLSPDVFDEGEPFEEYDITDFNQRGLNQIQGTMDDDFRVALWGYEMSPINNEKLEDWRWERATFAENPQGGATPNQQRFFDDPFFNSSNVRQSGETRVDIRVNKTEIEALLFWGKSNPVKKDVTFLIYPESGEGEPTEKTFKLNPIKDVFEGYSDVKVLSAAAILY